MSVQLDWRSVASANAMSLIARQADFPAASVLHTHDFAEVFVVEAGQASHVVDGIARDLSTGDMVFVSPSDCHQFVTPTSEFTITNVAFPTSFMTQLQQMAPQAKRVWGEGSTPVPIGQVDQIRVLGLAHQLARTPGPLQLLQFLSEALMVADRSDQVRSQPEWLRRSLAEWHRNPEAMRDGVAGIARLAGRSREHVSRVIRASTGKRAIDLVNESRIELAASLLQTTDEGIAAIANRAGFDSLSHFYHLFREQHETTPRQFRLHRKRVVGLEDG